jgi:flagellar motor switch protein FliN/FliY
MQPNLTRTLSLEVPIIVLLGERSMPLGDVVTLIPGAIIELPKAASEELDLLVNNKRIGTGTAVKVGENFGIRISRIGDARTRVRALGRPADDAEATDGDALSPPDAVAAEA